MNMPPVPTSPDNLRNFIRTETQKAYIQLGHARREHNTDEERWARGRLDGLRTILRAVDPRADDELREAHYRIQRHDARPPLIDHP